MKQIDTQILLVTPPERVREAGAYGLPLAHLAYRMGAGPHLFRASTAAPPRGGLMVIGSGDFDGRGEAAPFCREVVRECVARGFGGIVLDLETPPTETLIAVIQTLSAHCARSGWQFYLPEACAAYSETARLLVSSAMSGGALPERLAALTEQYGAARIVLCLARVAEDFYLPAPEGRGHPLSREELAARIEERSPSIFFSSELCAHYFTYMSRENGAHFVLFDDAGSLRHKQTLAAQLGIGQFFLFYEQLDDLLPTLLARDGR